MWYLTATTEWVDSLTIQCRAGLTMPSVDMFTPYRHAPDYRFNNSFLNRFELTFFNTNNEYKGTIYSYYMLIGVNLIIGVYCVLSYQVIHHYW